MNTLPYINRQQNNDGMPLVKMPDSVLTQDPTMPAFSDASEAKPLARVGEQHPIDRMSGQPALLPYVGQQDQEATRSNYVKQLNADFQKDANPYGSEGNHPGFLGKVAHGLNVAFGGVNRRKWEENDLADRINKITNDQVENQGRSATTQRVQQQIADDPQQQQDSHDLTRAKIGNFESEDYARKHPKQNLVHFPSDAGFMTFDPQTGETKPLLYNGAPVQVPQKLTQSQPIMGEDGKPHTYMLDTHGNKVNDLGEHYERPITINNGEAALDREVKQYGASHQKALDAADVQLEKINEAKAQLSGGPEGQAMGVPKAMTALVSGQGSGVRITQAELNAISKARGLGGDFTAAMQKFNSGKSLTPEQVKELTGMLDDARSRIMAKRSIHANALDTISGARDRNSIVGADTRARKAMSDMERFGHYEGETVMVKGHPVVINKIHPDGSFE